MPFILTIAKDINGLILSLDYAEREQIQNFSWQKEMGTRFMNQKAHSLASFIVKAFIT